MEPVLVLGEEGAQRAGGVGEAERGVRLVGGSGSIGPRRAGCDDQTVEFGVMITSR